MRVLVTGASGLFGANFLWQYARRFECIAASHRHPIAGAVRQVIPLDIAQASSVLDGVRRARPAVIVHAAAMTGVDACEEHPDDAMRINAQGTEHVARAARDVGAYLIYLSTDYVFDGTRGHYTEDDPPRPLGVYARTKWLGEQVVLAICPGATVVRTTLYGWNAQARQSFAERVLDGAAGGAPVTAFTDMYWSPLLANDLADAIAALMARPAPGLFHVAGRERCSRYDFALAVATVFGRDPGVVRPGRLHEARLRAPRPPDASLDVARFERTFGMTLPGVQAGLTRMRALQEAGIVPQLKQLVRDAPRS